MEIAVMGAGAVGCYFGGMLARAGHDVTLVARPVHVEAIRRAGLLMETLTFREHVRLRASTDFCALSTAQLVLFCVKATDTELTGAAIAPFLIPDCMVLSLQNGVDAAERLQPILGRPVLASVVRVAAEMVAPGHVRQQGGGELKLADGQAGCRVSAVLGPAGIPVHLTDNLPGAQWTKLGVNCAFNALSAVAQQPFGPLLMAEGVHELMQELMLECLAVACAAGVEVADDPWEALRRTGSQSAQYSSMAQDLARGRPTEIDHLNGHVVRLGAKLGVPTPANRSLQVVIKLIETRGAEAAARLRLSQ